MLLSSNPERIDLFLVKYYGVFILHDDCPQSMISCPSINTKVTRFIEVWIAEKYLLSNNFLACNLSNICSWDECHSNLTLLDMRLVNETWLEAHFCKTICCDNSLLYK
jgi:hypothetical protein